VRPQLVHLDVPERGVPLSVTGVARKLGVLVRMVDLH
jgi:hypothetical protein